MATSAFNFGDHLNVAPTQSMSDKIYNELSELIQNGTLPEGYVFPNESVLCEQLRVGRTSLREAYKALELFGYVTRTKRGTTVNSKTAIISATPLKVSMEQSSAKDFAEFRMMMERESVRLAAVRAKKNDIAELERLCNEIEKLIPQGYQERLVQLDRDFHRALAISSYNKLLISTMVAMGELWTQETKMNFFALTHDSATALSFMCPQHRNIVNALKAKDPEAAMEAMGQHIQQFSHK